jgi:hypothetical protein
VPKADKHDRAALKQLIAQQLVMPTKADAALLAEASKCPAWNASGADRAELGASLVVPAEYRFRDAHASHYAAYRAALARVAPHSDVFRKWVPMERERMALTLRYWRVRQFSPRCLQVPR